MSDEFDFEIDEIREESDADQKKTKREWKPYANVEQSKKPEKLQKLSLFEHMQQQKEALIHEKALMEFERIMSHAAPSNDFLAHKRLAEAAALRKAREEAARMETFKERQDKKRKLQELERKKEANLKLVRGNSSISSVFAGKPLVYDAITMKMRELKDNESLSREPEVEVVGMRIVPPTVTPYVAPQPIKPAERIARKSCFALTEGDEWIESSEDAVAAFGEFGKLAYIALTTFTGFGCANQAECRSKSCRHHTDISEVPLEKAICRGECTSDKIAVCCLPVNPFMGTVFALSEYVEKVENTLFENDETLTIPFRNDDGRFFVSMSSQRPTIADFIVRLRRDFHAERTSIIARQENDIRRADERFTKYYAMAVHNDDAVAKADLTRAQAQNIEAARALFDRSQTLLVNSFRQKVGLAVQHASVKIDSEGDQPRFKLPFDITVDMLLEIVMLRDGHHRGDQFYRDLATQISLGVCDFLLQEKEREQNELLAKNREINTTTMSKSANMDLLREFSRISRLAEPRTISQKRTASEREEAEEEAEDESQPLTNVHVDASRKVSAVQPVSGLGWLTDAKWRKPAGSSHEAFANGVAAQLFISVVAAHKIATCHDDLFANIDWERDVVQKAIDMWQEQEEGGSADFLSAVKRLYKSKSALQAATEQKFRGPWVEEAGMDADAVGFAAAVAVLESCAKNSEFGATLSCGSASVALAHKESGYFVFDSHPDQIDSLHGSTFAKFSNLTDLERAMQTRFKSISGHYLLQSVAIGPRE